MANPGQFPPMQPMGGQPMGMNPMMRPPAKQGTSKMVPVVVSAGLAVGVFCGLLFGLGTGKSVADPQKVSNGVKANVEDTTTPVPDTSSAKPAVKPPPKAGSAVPAVGSAAGGAAGGSATANGGAAGGSAAVPELKPGKIVIEISPESVAQKAKITVDGKPITGMIAEVPFEPGVTRKKVRVVIQAPGYDKLDREVDVEPGASSSLSLTRSSTGGDAAAAKDTGKDSGSKDTGSKDTGSKDTGSKSNTGKTKSTGKGKGSGLIDI
jgi:hypothetical protein